MNDYLESIKKRDPAAKSILSIILTYPGVKAVFFHQIAHFFCVAKFDILDNLRVADADILRQNHKMEQHKVHCFLVSPFRWCFSLPCSHHLYVALAEHQTLKCGTIRLFL